MTPRKDRRMELLKSFFGQTRKPEGAMGKFMLSTMNSSHAKLADWGMNHLPAIQPDSVIDLGCGAGRNAGELLKRYPKSMVTALDYSLLSVEKTKAYNQSAVEAGRLSVLEGNVSALPFEDASFDLVTAFETVYFWPGLEKCFAQVARILKPGGTFLIVNESDGLNATGRRFEKIIDGMKVYKAEEIKMALKAAGFRKVQANHHANKPWIEVMAVK